MNNKTSQFNIDLDGTYRNIDTLHTPLLSANDFKSPKGAHLLRGR